MVVVVKLDGMVMVVKNILMGCYDLLVLVLMEVGKICMFEIEFVIVLEVKDIVVEKFGI